MDKIHLSVTSEKRVRKYHVFPCGFRPTTGSASTVAHAPSPSPFSIRPQAPGHLTFHPARRLCVDARCGYTCGRLSNRFIATTAWAASRRWWRQLPARWCCKGPLGATLGTERNGHPRRSACPQIFFLFFSLLISCPPHCLVLDNKTSTTYTPQSHSFPLSLPLFSIFPFFSTSCLALSDNTFRHKAATTR
jgi:hypothetical protein